MFIDWIAAIATTIFFLLGIIIIANRLTKKKELENSQLRYISAFAIMIIPFLINGLIAFGFRLGIEYLNVSNTLIVFGLAFFMAPRLKYVIKEIFDFKSKGYITLAILGWSILILALAYIFGPKILTGYSGLVDDVQIISSSNWKYNTLESYSPITGIFASIVNVFGLEASSFIRIVVSLFVSLLSGFAFVYVVGSGKNNIAVLILKWVMLVFGFALAARFLPIVNENALMWPILIFIVLMVNEFILTQDKTPLYLAYLLSFVIAMTIKDPAPTLVLPMISLSLYALLVDSKIGRDVILLTVSFALVSIGFIYIQYLFFSIPILILSAMPLWLIHDRYSNFKLKFDDLVGRFGNVTIQVIVALIAAVAVAVNITTTYFLESSIQEVNVYAIISLILSTIIGLVIIKLLSKKAIANKLNFCTITLIMAIMIYVQYITNHITIFSDKSDYISFMGLGLFLIIMSIAEIFKKYAINPYKNAKNREKFEHKIIMISVTISSVFAIVALALIVVI